MNLSSRIFPSSNMIRTRNFPDTLSEVARGRVTPRSQNCKIVQNLCNKSIDAGGFHSAFVCFARARRLPTVAPSDRVVCILTGHQLKDPTATVAYHTTDQEQFHQILGQRGVKRASHANRAVAVPNDLAEIIKAIRLYS